MNSRIAPEIRRFILSSIPSVPYLEALLLMRNELQTPWTATRLAQRIYVSEKIAAQLLMELTHFGIAEESELAGEFRFQPRFEELRNLLDQLAETYPKHLVEVTHLIHSKANRKAHQFADAFKLRKDS